MVNILEEVPTFAQSFAKNFGAGIGEGIPKGIEFAQKMGIKRKADLKKNLSKLTPSIKSHLSLYDKNKAFDADMIGQLDKRAREYIEMGASTDEAIGQAYQEMINESQSQPGKKEYSDWEGNPELLKDLGIVSDEGFLEDVKTGLKKGIRPLVQLADFPFALAKRMGVTPRGKTLNDFDTLIDYYDKFTEGKGQPQNIVERLTSGYPLGGAGIAAAGVEEVLDTFGVPESVKEAAGVLTLLLSHRLKIPEANAVVKRAEKVAQETGRTPETVLKEAQEASGVKMEDIAKGDESAIRSLKDKITESPKVSEKVSQSPKSIFNKKAAERERRIFGEKLAESPLDEYYNIKAREVETQASKRPETIAREKEIRATLAPEEKRLLEDLRYKRDDLARMDKARKNLIGQEKERVDALYQYRMKSIEESTEKLKDIQYQMKYGRLRPSEAEINAKIDESIKRFKDGIENPTPQNIKDLDRQLELDKKYIERASKLAERGELSGEIRPDTFLRMKSKYLEGYKAAVKESKETINSLKQADDPMALSSIAKEKKLIDTIQNRIKRLEADIVNQTDNIKAMRALEKPSGAFYKQQLKSLKKDEALFKNDLFKHRHLKSPEDLKVFKTYKENSPEVKLGKETVENLSAENLKKASDQIGKTEEKIAADLKKEGHEFREASKKINEGIVSPNVESKFSKNLKKYGRLFGVGFAVGAAQAFTEEVFNVKVDSKILRYIGYISGVGTFGGTTIGHNAVRSLFDNAQANHLKTLRKDPRAWNKYINNMRKSNGEEKVKRVLKIANS